MAEKQGSKRDGLAQARTDYAIERTRMAATRTIFAILRTGIAIAGGGTLVTAILGRGWPDWVVAILSGIFIITGLSMTLIGLRNYGRFAEKLQSEQDMELISPRVLLFFTFLLQGAILIVLVLFLLN